MSSIGFPRVGTALALSLLVSCGSAIAGEYAVGLKAGALLEGAQNTLKNGAGGGVIVVLGAPEPSQFEFGLTYGQDAGGGQSQDPRVTVWALDARARRFFRAGQVRPFVEVGLGLYDLTRESTIPGAPGETSTTALGGPFGAGAAIAFSHQSTLRIGVEYHWIAAEFDVGVVGASSGNLEDYVWIGAAFTYRLSSGS